MLGTGSRLESRVPASCLVGGTGGLPTADRATAVHELGRHAWAGFIAGGQSVPSRTGTDGA